MPNNISEEIRKLKEEINRSFENSLEKECFRDYSGQEPYFKTPLADLEETENELIARFDIPGVEKKDIKLDIKENKVEICVEKKKEESIHREGFLKEERSYKGFCRAIYLPEEVIPEEAAASYEDGILEVIMPKSEKSKKRRIEVE